MSKECDNTKKEHTKSVLDDQSLPLGYKNSNG